MPTKRDQNTLIYEDPNGKFRLTFTHKNLKDIPRNMRDEFQEAIDRFASLLVENIENMDKYKETGHTQVSGIITTIKKLREANVLEDEMSSVEPK